MPISRLKGQLSCYDAVMDIDEALEALAHPGEDGTVAPDALSLVASEYKKVAAELGTLRDVSSAKIGELTESAEKSAETIKKLKAENYDFFHSQPAIKKTDDSNEDDKPSGIESLFESGDK